MHERPAAPDGRSRPRSARTGTRRRRSPGMQMAIGANSPFFFGRELWRETRIALFEQTTDTRPGGAQGPGRAPARVVRRALDHVDLRPLRGERPLLPGAAAGGRGRGPDGRAGERRRAEAAGAAAAQRHDLPLEPADLRHRPRPPAPARGEPRAAGRADDRRHARQRRLLLRARARAGRGRPPGLDRRCPSRPPTRTSTRARSDGHRRPRLLAGRRRGARDRARAAPAAADGPRRPVALGRRRRPTPTA